MKEEVAFLWWLSFRSHSWPFGGRKRQSGGGQVDHKKIGSVHEIKPMVTWESSKGLYHCLKHTVQLGLVTVLQPQVSVQGMYSVCKAMLEGHRPLLARTAKVDRDRVNWRHGMSFPFPCLHFSLSTRTYRSVVSHIKKQNKCSMSLLWKGSGMNILTYKTGSGCLA